MNRRDLFALLGGAAVLPLAASAQKSTPQLVGFLSSLSAGVTKKRIGDFSGGLGEEGVTVGKDIIIEQRLADGQYERLPTLAAELVARQVRLIAALAPPAAFAARAATSTIPIVFVGAFDPVKAGLIASLNKPGGNVTGITFMGTSLAAKRLEIAGELVPNAALIAVLTHTNSPDARQDLDELQRAAALLRQELLVLSAPSDGKFDETFAQISQHRAQLLIIGADPLLFQHTDQIVRLAAQHRIPTIYAIAESVAAGGLISYGASVRDAWRLAGNYAGRILKGDKPENLPVVQPTRFDLAINLRTAQALGLTLPPTLLARADEVIE